MKVIRTITTELELNLEITEATLLTVEEAKKLPKRLLRHNSWWWLRSPVNYGHRSSYVTYVATVSDDGSVYDSGIHVSTIGDAVRPALVISNIESSGLKIGDTFEFGGKIFEIISNDKAFCLTDIGTSAFRYGREVDNANDYEKSDIKIFIDEWFEKSKNESNSKGESVTMPITNANIEKSDTKKYIDEYIDEKFEEIKEIKEELDKLSKEVKKLCQSSHYDISYTEIPPYCKNCKNHPINGGSGLCNCILGNPFTY